MSRDLASPAPGWHLLAPGVWVRNPPPLGIAALVRSAGGGFVMRMGAIGGPWLAAGDTLLAATEHAGGHAARLELMAARGGDDLVGNCATCARMGAKEGGR